MDGFGLAPAGDNNAVFKANKPYLDKLWEEYRTPRSVLRARTWACLRARWATPRSAT